MRAVAIGSSALVMATSLLIGMIMRSTRRYSSIGGLLLVGLIGEVGLTDAANHLSFVKVYQIYYNSFMNTI